ncbi:Outer membrane protein OmpA [Prosthecobacter debontii]|uniref:Outer membrane protein OmpA n=1 Tax=Prosthecobacter debontii TaxID=48467 RepID=A0A1T4YSK8_9BACT|nr:OmpA family protein [Prosthecobacter debontii]SKB04804.1 Outer membrane protein OmpA [Prosthecobacter debontii]
MLRSYSPRHSRADSLRSGGVLPVVIVVLALLVSAAIFFFITRPQMEKAAEEKAAQAAAESAKPAEASKKEVTATPAPPATSKPAPKAPTPPPAPAKPSFGFARPLDLGKEMVRSLNAGDYKRAGDLAAAADPDQAKLAAEVFEKIFKGMKAKVGQEDQVELLGLVENKTRLSIPLMLPGKSDPVRLQLDIERDTDMGWKISSLSLPAELGQALATSAEASSTPAMAATAGSAAAPAAGAPMVPAAKPASKNPLFKVEEMPDALTFGSDFVRALLKHDFEAAGKYVDPKKVPAERLIGLCIVFEEGEYELKPSKPLIITVANPEVSWIIAQVQSQKLQQSTEFGLEMQRSGVDQPWKIVGLNLSEILGSFASSATKLGVPYTPIVSNPKGGESLALYFEYDQAELHPRALKQLEIVSSLLKSDPSKKLQIAGHTDAKGTDTYNLSLSQTRAESVKKQLIAMGVAESQVVTTALGKAQPLSPNQKADGSDDPEGRSKNRRAEIYLDF